MGILEVSDPIAEHVQAAVLLDGADPRTTLTWAVEQYGDKVAMATGFGPEGVVLIDLLCQVTSRPNIFYLDTDFLFDETHDLRRSLTRRYNFDFQRISGGLTPERQAEQYGPSLWARDPDLCCGLRKVRPLTEHLSGLDAWITSIRRDQTVHRANIKVVDWDAKFNLVKINPLAAWTSEQVWDYIRENNLPYNKLHDQNYKSIGCTHCTRPVNPEEDERAGRWSWTAKTECGLHR